LVAGARAKPKLVVLPVTVELPTVGAGVPVVAAPVVEVAVVVVLKVNVTPVTVKCKAAN